MTDGFEISRGLEQWGTLAGYTLTHASYAHDGRALFWSAGGEVRLFVQLRDDGWYVITRSERLGEEYFSFAAPLMSTLERYLFGKFGRSIRSDRGLPLVPMPTSLDEVSSGFFIEARFFDGVERLTLISHDGYDGTVAAICGGGKLIATAALAELSLYLTTPVNDIMASFLAADGKPLFAPQ